LKKKIVYDINIFFLFCYKSNRKKNVFRSFRRLGTAIPHLGWHLASATGGGTVAMWVEEVVVVVVV
jgi:hypothetical protein